MNSASRRSAPNDPWCNTDVITHAHAVCDVTRTSSIYYVINKLSRFYKATKFDDLSLILRQRRGQPKSFELVLHFHRNRVGCILIFSWFSKIWILQISPKSVATLKVKSNNNLKISVHEAFKSCPWPHSYLGMYPLKLI